MPVQRPSISSVRAPISVILLKVYLEKISRRYFQKLLSYVTLYKYCKQFQGDTYKPAIGSLLSDILLRSSEKEQKLVE